MMMQCPRCSTRWRVATASPMENPLFKCGRCHHLFRQFPGAPAPAEAANGSNRRSPPSSEPDTLEFIFPDRQPAAIVVPAAAEVTRVAPANANGGDETTALVHQPPPLTAMSNAIALEFDDAMPAVDSPRVAADGATPLQELMSSEATTFDLPEDARAEDAGDDLGDDLLAEPNDDDTPILGNADEEDEDADADTVDAPVRAPGRTVRVEDIMRTPAGFGTIMRGIGAAVGVFAALALVVRVSPERATAWLARLPIAGVQFAHDRNLATKVELRNVQGRFQRLRNARRVFVISGDARNNSPVTIERIEVAGALYDLGGGELDQKVVTTGNRTALTDLSEAEIVLLQRLDPAIALAPGQTTPFLIVFLEPPRELREFSSRVLSVRPTRRASTLPPPASSHRDSVG